MDKRRLTYEALGHFLDGVVGARTAYGPMKSEGFHLFGPLSGKKPDLTFPNTRNAPKNALFKHTETLATFTRTPSGMEYVADGEEMPEAVLFVRPCDAANLALLDKVFGWKPFDDPYYQARREKTTIVAVACVKAPYSTCFCTSVGGEPVGEKNADVLMTDLGDGYLVEFLTEKGQKLAQFAHGEPPASAADLAGKEEVRKAAALTVNSTVPARAILPVLKRIFEHPYWATIHRRCLACGTCTYLCPSCHCFDIADEVKDEGGARIRSWDSCMYPLFTRETSGHNPRPTQRERWRQRVMHKFSYIPENFDEIGCVGCGRCVLNCPVGIDIRSIVEDIAKL